MEREGNKGPDGNNGTKSADVETDKTPTKQGEEEEEEATGVSQETYEKAKDDAVKDLHG